MFISLISNGRQVTPQPSDPITPWWSFTKTVLAATALALVRDRLTGLDDLVEGQPFSLRQLLRHEAGLADYGELVEYHAALANHESPWSADDMLQRLDATRLRYAPGTGWGYSNVGYMFIARLIERITDLTIEEAVRRYALQPLDLANVRFAATRADVQPTATDYDPAWVYHGLLIGPLSHAAQFLDRLLDGHLLPGALLQEMQTVKVLGGPMPGRPWVTPGYGLGLMQGSIEGGLTLSGHTGCGPGSIIAVYRLVHGDETACCACMATDSPEGVVEAQVVQHLRQSVRA